METAITEKTEEKKIKIRKLKVSDRKRLSALIKALAETAKDESLLNVISSALSASPVSGDNDKEENKEESIILVGIKMLQSLLSILEEETQAWFMNLIDVTKEDFLNLPIDTEMIIIEQLVESAEAKSFFTIASRLYSKIELLQNKFTVTKGKFDSKTD